MSILSRLFVPKDAEPIDDAPATSPAAAHRTIRHDPMLMDSLEKDHVLLKALFQRIGTLLEQNQIDEIRGELVNFKTRLEAHILTENVRFYTYLEQSLAGDMHNAELMRDFRREMNTIARGVVSFVKKYQSIHVTAQQFRAEFADDYRAVGELLAQRLEREENSLYPLYQPD